MGTNSPTRRSKHRAIRQIDAELSGLDEMLGAFTRKPAQAPGTDATLNAAIDRQIRLLLHLR